jgi:hypothetical protein
MSPFEIGYADGYARRAHTNPFCEGEAEFDEYEDGYKAGSAIRAIGGLI